jgi:hypothetical protein
MSKDVSIVDVLTGRAQVTAQMKITPSQRLYYNYRIDKPSFDAEITQGRMPHQPRDFRSKREREQDL